MMQQPVLISCRAPTGESAFPHEIGHFKGHLKGRSPFNTDSA